MHKKVGEFEITVSSPFPMWIEISHPHQDGKLMFSHRELLDIEYAIASAKAEVLRQLPDEKL